VTAPKVLNQWGFGVKVESTYGTINAPAVGDGVLLKQVPDVDVPHWVNDGERGSAPGGGRRQNAPASGRWGGYKVMMEGIGAGAAYSAGVKPHGNVLIQSAGFTETGAFGVGTETYQYTPAVQPTALTSITSDVNLSGHLYRLFGAYSNLEISAAGPMIPDWAFDITGAMDFVTDAAIPAYTSYPAIANVPMKADGITATIGVFTAGVVKSFGLKAGRDHSSIRANQAGGFSVGMSGYTPGLRRPQLELVVERVTLATVTPWSTATTLNPYRMAEEKNPVIVRVSVGTVQYKRWHIYSGTGITAGLPTPAAQATLIDVKDTAEGPTATWTLTFDLHTSTYTASDDYAILFN